MTTPLSPRFQKVTLGTYTVLNVTGFTANREAAALDATTLGNSGWGGSLPGIKNLAGTITGFYDRGDSTGQKTMMSAWENGNKLTNMRLYHDNTSYATPDITNDSNSGIFITNYRETADRGSLLGVTFDFASFGQMTEV